MEHNNAQLELQQKNIATLKKQIQALEDRNRSYESTIIKHESTIDTLRKQTSDYISKLSHAESSVGKLTYENRSLREAEARLRTEHDVLLLERRNQNLLMSNLDMIKTAFERTESESKVRLESRLDNSERECSALRRLLQEEKTNYKELTSQLSEKTEKAVKRMEEEVKVAETLKCLVSELRAEIEKKTEKIKSLSEKLQSSMTPNQDDNPVTVANKKIKEMEMKLKEDAIEIEALKKELETSKANCSQYQNLSESSEKELNSINNEYQEFRAQAEAELDMLRKSEMKLKEQVEIMQTDISLEIATRNASAGDSNTALHKAQCDLKDALAKISELSRQSRDWKEKVETLMVSLEASEQKYAKEMINHSEDLQKMTILKENMSRVQEQFDELTNSRDRAVTELESLKYQLSTRDGSVENEKEELVERLKLLEEQNTLLLNQINELSEKWEIRKVQKDSDDGGEDANSSRNVEDIDMNSSAIEKQESSYEVLQIIKYLRREKDIFSTRCEVMAETNARLRAESEMAQNKIKELQEIVDSQQTQDSSLSLSAAKHEDLLRKLETLNAITDSNRTLRNERDTYAQQVDALKERVTKVEDELIPLQEKNRELSVKTDTLLIENTTLKTEATRWRNRANSLVERSNKQSPEDWKKLQTERENYLKAYNIEKEHHKKTMDDFNAFKVEKQKLDLEIANLSKQINVISTDNRKFTEELQQLRQANAKFNLEFTEVKSKLVLKEDEMAKMEEEMRGKEAVLSDLKNKESQLRKIAKRYKDMYTELKKNSDEKAVTALIGDNLGNDEMGEPSTSQEPSHEQKMKDLTEQQAKLQEENNRLKEEQEALSQSAESNKNLLKEARIRMLALTESKNQACNELLVERTKVQTLEQTKAGHEIFMKNMKSQYEMKISQLENEVAKLQEKDATLNRLRGENENLMMRVQQLQRQLDRPSSKPSTSTEKNLNDASPRTANVKPMAGPSQQSATVQPWRGSSSSGDTPLASIRPISVQNNRTAAVMPTSQSSNIASVQGSSSSGSSSSSSTSTATTNVTALVPPQQQVHTTGSQPGEAMSSSPTSSHTDYMPATSSAGVAVVAVVPMGSNAAESSSQSLEAEVQNNESIQVATGGQPQQQQVALVSPRIESAPQNLSQQQINEQSPSTSASALLSAVSF